ncbi:MAG: nuclear transport factor 2 family protein [Gammaproteobacteria bacterium]
MSSFKSALLIAGILVAPLASAADAPSTASVQDRAAVQNLIARYAFALDSLNADMYASVFAPDAELTFGGNTYKGRDKIHGVVTSIKERRAAQPASDKPTPKSYHVITNTLIEFTDDTHANHRSYWQTVSGPSSGPFAVGGAGVYEDTIVKVNGAWLIQKRNIIQ